jgi:hypothetical protein
MAGGGVDPTAEFAQLQRHVVDHPPWRYEVIRPLVLWADRTATPRAQETHTHPETVRALTRRFRQQGMSGLRPAHVEVIPPRPSSSRPPSRASGAASAQDPLCGRSSSGTGADSLLHVRLSHRSQDGEAALAREPCPHTPATGTVGRPHASGSLPSPPAGHHTLLPGVGQDQYPPVPERLACDH